MVPSNDQTMIISVFCYVVLMIGVSETNIAGEALHRERRQLLWPNSTLYQLNIGVTTPTPIKTINIGWAIQANFQLPWNRSQIPFDLLEANSGYTGLSRKRRDAEPVYENDAKLFHFYKYVEEMLTSYGHNGSSCVLRTLCQLGAEPLHPGEGDDLLHELASYVLNPTNDISDQEPPSKEAAPYVQAFEHGRTFPDCSRFHCTSISLINLFSKIHDQS